MVLGWILGRILLWKILELEEKTLDELENYPKLHTHMKGFPHVHCLLIL